MYIDAVMRRGAELLGRPELVPPAHPGAVADVPRDDAEAMLLAGLRSDTRTHQLLAAALAGAPAVNDKALRRVTQLLTRRPPWISAEVLPGDALFLYDMVRLLKPDRILEIGTGSGFSGSFLLAALADNGTPLRDDRNRPALESFDICERCAWDESHATGDAIRDVVPGLGRGVRFHRSKTAPDAPKALRGHRFTFAFVDASHRHPWPLADVLSIAPLLAPGAWICLHDIALVEVALLAAKAEQGGDTSAWQCRGPQLLYDHWPWPKVRGVGLGANVGAVQVPEAAALTREAFAALVRYPWECKPTPELTAVLGEPPRYRYSVAPAPVAH